MKVIIERVLSTYFIRNIVSSGIWTPVQSLDRNAIGVLPFRPPRPYLLYYINFYLLINYLTIRVIESRRPIPPIQSSLLGVTQWQEIFRICTHDNFRYFGLSVRRKYCPLREVINAVPDYYDVLWTRIGGHQPFALSIWWYAADHVSLWNYGISCVCLWRP